MFEERVAVDYQRVRTVARYPLGRPREASRELGRCSGPGAEPGPQQKLSLEAEAGSTGRGLEAGQMKAPPPGALVCVAGGVAESPTR